MKYLKVKRGQAEKARKKLASEGLIDLAYSVERDGEFVFFPVTSDVKFKGGSIQKMMGKRSLVRHRSLKEALEGVLSDRELDLLQSSFNIVGDIAILELNKELLPKKKEIGQAMLDTFRNLKVVALKIQEVSGEYRVPGIEVLVGENRTETFHKEHGCIYKLDIAHAYFSPRLGHERMRVVNQIRDDERVLVMFAGVGPYAILAAKKTKAEIVAVELNPNAVEYMRWNVIRNKMDVDVHEGDVRKVTPILGKFDRIIMPLPKQADSFLDVAIEALKSGGIIHYYTFAHNTLEATSRLAETIGGLGHRIKILTAIPCGSYSPCMDRICVDFTVE
jgi:tRNA (guanine37-N1)-methyltransferase